MRTEMNLHLTFFLEKVKEVNRNVLFIFSGSDKKVET